ncbi:MAG: hypothetical protein BGO31_08705 [Bacteroidetes bacterium 43-16]|nr:MAG: hypothetical protein BGO31_08705 [Bacteroidetes bacterium 43-16]
MKKIKFLLLLLAQAFFLQAQVQEAGVSKYFKTSYPEDMTLMPLSSNKTMLVRLHSFNELNVHIYDEGYKEVVHVSSKLPLQKIKNSRTFGAMEMSNGNVSFFLVLLDDGSDRTIYKVVLNGITGVLESCTEINRFPNKKFGMWALYTDGMDMWIEQSENKQYSVLYFKNYEAEHIDKKQEIWVMDKAGNVIEKTGINQDKEGKYPKGIGLIGINITNDGTVYAITTNYKSDKDMKRHFIKKALKKDIVVSRLCGVSDKNDFKFGYLKFNAIKNEAIFVNDKNYTFKIDNEGNCKKELLIFREIMQLKSAHIKSKRSDEFHSRVVDVDIEADGSYTYTLVVHLEREETHHSMTSRYPYVIGYATWNDKNADFCFVPTFLWGISNFQSAPGLFNNLRQDDINYFATLKHQNSKYFLFNDNEKSRNRLEDAENLKRIQNIKSSKGFYAKIEPQQTPPKAATIENTSEGTTFYYWGTARVNPKGELIVIKLLDGDKMQLVWLNIKS